MEHTEAKQAVLGKQKVSAMRKLYMLKFAGRCAVLVLCLLAALLQPKAFEALGDFTGRLSGLHLLWLAWMADMLLQLVYVKKHVPLGSQKLFSERYLPARAGIDPGRLQVYIKEKNKSAYQVFLIYAAGIMILGQLKKIGLLGDIGLFLFCVFFYVCDLICVLFWCPFRIFMKTRCCTECRIFNWDHLMMFSPLLFVDGFYAKSLVVTAAAVFFLWEYHIAVHPERFWEGTNEALRCDSCTDKLCSQYCGKKRY